jgi:TonB family protein
MKIGGWILVLMVSVCGGLRAELRLRAEFEGKRLSVAAVENGRIWLDDGGVRVPVPNVVTWKLDGDLEAEAEFLLWRVPGALRRPPNMSEKEAAVWTAAVLFPRTPSGKNWKDELIDWPAAKAPGGLAVAAWVVDGAVTRVGVAALPSGDWSDKFRIGVTLDVPREEIGGMPVAMFWAEGAFAKPERLFADAKQALAEKAARRGDVEGLRRLADEGAALAFANEKGWTLLHVAAAAGRTEVAEFLIEKAPVFFVSDYSKWQHSPLEEAVGWYRVETMKRLLTRGVGLQMRAFGQACEQGKTEMAKWMSASQKSWQFAGAYRYMIVNRAVANGHEDIAALLVQWSFLGPMSLDEKDELLVRAARLGYGQLAQALVGSRAAARLRVKGEPLLHLAARHEATEVMTALMGKGARWQDTDAAGKNALQAALLAGSREAALLLFKSGARLDVAAKDAGLYLEAAVAVDAAEILKDAIARDWKPDTAFPDGLSAHYVAMIYRARECLVVLKEAGAREDAAPGFPVFTSLGKLDAPPKPLMSLRLDDPYEAYESFPETKVPVKVLVDPQGRVQLPLVAAEINPRLRASVVAKVKTWRFEPMTVQGKPVGVAMSLPLTMPEAVAAIPVPFQWPVGVWGGNEVAEAKGVSQQPRMIKQTPPRYPNVSVRKNVTVTLRFVVDRNGDVEPGVEVVSSNNKAFNDAAVAAVLTWKFEPGFVSGQPVRTRFQAPIIFAPVEKTPKGSK